MSWGLDELAELLRESIRIEKIIALDLQELLRRIPRPTATQVGILFANSKGQNMPLTLPVGDQDNFYIFGTRPFLGALLGPGQTISVASADPSSVTLTADPSPLPIAAADATPAVPAGTPTILSGIAASAATPAQVGVPITCTITVLNSDGSAAETLSDTVTLSATAATALGDLFGTATPVTQIATGGAAAPAAKIKK